MYKRLMRKAAAGERRPGRGGPGPGAAGGLHGREGGHYMGVKQRTHDRTHTYSTVDRSDSSIVDRLFRGDTREE